MTRSRLWLLAIAPILAVAIVATQHFADAQSQTSPALRGFDTCAELHEHYMRLAEESAYEKEQVEYEVEEQAEVEAMSEADVATREDDAFVEDASTSPSDDGEVSETGTNVQERGVDESDIIKTDGTYVYILRSQALLIAEISEDGPLVVVGRMVFREQGHRQELLIDNGTAIVVRQLNGVGSTNEIDDEDLPEPTDRQNHFREQSEILEIDISNAASPSLVAELNLDGRFLSARLVGDGLRVAMQHSSAVPWISAPAFRLGQWFPLFGFQNHIEGTFRHGYAVDCTQAFAPEERLPTRWGELPSIGYMLSFDLTAGISDWGGVAVLGMATNPTVYASKDSLYLASPHNGWRDTAIHRFDISNPLAPTYFGGAIVTGELLSQWSLSEHEGYLRVATTDWNRWPTVSSVTVLEAVKAESGGDGTNAPTGLLQQVGHVSGLGATESIFAVRFAGDVGYVVTFRQVDPLYVLDLSDPADPRQVGELKIPGFSRYLHPLSGGLLLGVGRDADPQTGRERGLQATLFDVSDPAEPTQIAVLPLGDDAFSPVEFDHRAFRYQAGVAWIPVGPDDYSLRQHHDGAFMGVRVRDDGLTHETTLRIQGEARRAIPVGEQIHLLSSEEIRTYDLEDYVDLGALSFAPEWDNRWLPIQPE